MATVKASLVLESGATLAAFRTAFERDLVRRGFRILPATVYDLTARGHDANAYLRLTYHERGFLLEAKVKTGFFGNPHPALHSVLAAAREAQAAEAAAAKRLVEDL
ncbi:MAG: hypothetical protein ACT4PT_03940 [Methanobacteriota archaeon]